MRKLLSLDAFSAGVGATLIELARDSERLPKKHRDVFKKRQPST